MSLRLPDRPNLDLLKRQAKAALRVGRLLHPTWRLSDAQRALAKGYGLANWADLKVSVVAQNHVSRPADTEAAAGDTTRDLVAAASPGPPHRFVGAWMSCAAESERVALEIAEVAGALQLTQVVSAGDRADIASSLLLRIDGRDHQLPVSDRLLLRARWRDERTLHMTVTREAATVAEGTYVLSEDGLTLRVTANARIIVFERAPSERPPAGAPSSRAVRQAVRAGLVATMMFHGSCADVATRAGSTLPDRQRDADISAIEALNRHDVTAALASDIEAIVSQWSEDFVLLPQAGEFVRGRAANVAMIEGARHHLETFEPIAYDVYFEEIVVTGDYAFAWGRFRTAARPRAGGTDIVSNGKLLRIYQRQRDGRWLMHRTMSTMEPLGR